MPRRTPCDLQAEMHEKVQAASVPRQTQPQPEPRYDTQDMSSINSDHVNSPTITQDLCGSHCRRHPGRLSAPSSFDG